MANDTKNITPATIAKTHVFFLGGADAEMIRVKEVLEVAGCEIYDAELDWSNAKASAYAEEIVRVAEEGKIPVLLELGVDCDLPETAVVFDHHGKRSGEPPIIIQVLSLLGIEPSRDDVLIGAMDAGFVFGLESIGAKKEEIAGFLELDSADGMSMRDMLLATESGSNKDVITEAEQAVAEREQVGEMIVVRSAHSKTGPITTRLVGEQDMQNILILSGNGEVNYYGTGGTVRELGKKFPIPGSWDGGAGLMPHTPEGKAFWEQWGGTAPNNAYWGGYPDHQEVLNFLSKKFA